MESVFEQTFTDYEYIIIDGGSDDESKDIIKQHEDKLAWWISEKDKGVYHAMNKGIAKARGEYLYFLNSGDFLYSSESLSIFFENSSGEDIIYGNIQKVAGIEKYIKAPPTQLTFSFFLKDTLPHQSTIIKQSVFAKTGLYNESYKIVSDWEVIMNGICLYQATYKHIDQCVAVFSTDGFSSDIQNAALFKQERKSVVDKFYQGFINDYHEAEECKSALNNCTATLQNISNSHLYKFLRQITKSRFYRMIRRVDSVKMP